MADAAIHILEQSPQKCSGNTFLDEQVLRDAGVSDFSRYVENPAMANQVKADIFLDDFTGL